MLKDRPRVVWSCVVSCVVVRGSNDKCQQEPTSLPGQEEPGNEVEQELESEKIFRARFPAFVTGIDKQVHKQQLTNENTCQEVNGGGKA